MQELFRAPSLQTLALQLPPLYPRRWKEANGRGTAAGVLVLWEEGSVPGSHWHHIHQAGASSWGSGNRGPRRQRGGAGMCY